MGPSRTGLSRASSSPHVSWKTWGRTHCVVSMLPFDCVPNTVGCVGLSRFAAVSPMPRYAFPALEVAEVPPTLSTVARIFSTMIHQHSHKHLLRCRTVRTSRCPSAIKFSPRENFGQNTKTQNHDRGKKREREGRRWWGRGAKGEAKRRVGWEWDKKGSGSGWVCGWRRERERPGLHTTSNSESSKRALVGDFGLDPRREGRQNEKWGGRVKKKSEILGGPAEGGRGGGGLGEVGQTNSTNYD